VSASYARSAISKRDAPLTCSTTLLYGRFILDNGRLNQHRRAQIGFISWCLPMLACITWISINRTQFTKNTPYPAYDWTDAGWANGE
jgi:hypothetical protein